MAEKKNDILNRYPKIAGIKTNMQAYKLAWQINECYGMNFAMNMDWTKEVSASDSSFHQHYFCNFEDVELSWHLINNRGTHSFFFKSKPMFDFLLICNGDDMYNYFDRAIESIKLNKFIDHIYKFEFDLVKSKSSFFNNTIKNKYFLEDLHV